VPVNPKTGRGAFPWPGRGPFFADRFTPRRLGFGNAVWLTQEYVEVVNSGDPASQFVRVTQLYIEVVCTFGTPPLTKGKKDDPPGKRARTQSEIAFRYRALVRRHRSRYGPRFPPVAGWAPTPAAFIPSSSDAPKYRNTRRVITSGGDGHTVRIREG